MNTRNYLTKIHTHLHDHNTYKPLTHNSTSAIANDSCTLIEYMHSTMEFLLPPNNTRTPLFYGLPKIHKPDCPYRPIASACDGLTDHLSACIIRFIQPLARIFHHTSETQNIFSILLIKFYPSHPMASWSELTPHLNTQTSNTKKA